MAGRVCKEVMIQAKRVGDCFAARAQRCGLKSGPGWRKPRMMTMTIDDGGASVSASGIQVKHRKFYRVHSCRGLVSDAWMEHDLLHIQPGF